MIMLDTKQKSSYKGAMNKLPVATRAQILSMLCEGASMRSVSRLTDTSINTVSKLLEDAGRFCAGFHDVKVRGVKARRVQVDELWSFCAAKDKNVATMKSPIDGAGKRLDVDGDRSRNQVARFSLLRRPRWRMRQMVY